MVQVIANGPPGDAHVYPVAVVLATFSLFVVLLNAPTMAQHYRNRNVGATALVAGVILANFQNFLNAIIWHNDEFDNWFTGVGLCDVEVKIQVFRQVLFPSSVLCILRALANVMDTDRAAWNHTTAQKRRQLAIDLLCVIGAPTLQMVFHFIVQPYRFLVYGIVGCQASTDVLIVVRLIRYRLTFNTILANSSTTKSRFMRLYLLACVWILGILPVEALTLYLNNIGELRPFEWSATHPAFEIWNSSFYVASNGRIKSADRIIYIVGGFVIFLLFGWGRDAMKLYRDALLAAGFGKFFPALRPDYEKGSFAATVTSIGSKAKLYLNKKRETWSPTSTLVSNTDSMTSSMPSPKKIAFLSTIRENHAEDERLRRLTGPQKPSCLFCRFFRSNKKIPQDQEAGPFAMNHIATSPNTLNIVVSAEPVSPTHTRPKSDVMVVREVRQASETADTIPVIREVKMYEGV